jgi:hypothetical protein
VARGDKLWQRLEVATELELRRLADIVGLADASAKRRDVLVEQLSSGLRAAAGHSIRNLFRGPHDFPYKQMLIDVADKLAPGWTFLSWTSYRLNDTHSEEEIEEAIWGFYEAGINLEIASLPLEKRKELAEKTKAELQRFGYSDAVIAQVTGVIGGATASLAGPALAYQIALSTASGVAWLKLWWFGYASAAAAWGASGVLFGLLYLPVLGWWLGNTAYRKTIPATLKLIEIRKLRALEETLSIK